jgi:capsular polysaccharide biosynthesis protein
MKYVNHLLRRYGLLVLLTVLGALAGSVYDLVTTPTYVAKSYVVVAAAQGDGQSAVNFAQAYGRIVATQSVTGLAAGTLGSNNGLSDVTASTSPDAPVVEITATGTDAKHTAAVANAVAQALVRYGSTQTDTTHVTLSVLATAAVPTTPASPKPPLEPAIGAVAGALVGGLALLAGVGSVRARKQPADPEVIPRGYPAAPLALPPASRALPWPDPAGQAAWPDPAGQAVWPASAGRAAGRAPVGQAAGPDPAGQAAGPDPAGQAAGPDPAGYGVPAPPPVEEPRAVPPVVGRAVVIYREEPK